MKMHQLSLADEQDDPSIRTTVVWKNNPFIGSCRQIKPQLEGVLNHIYIKTAWFLELILLLSTTKEKYEF